MKTRSAILTGVSTLSLLVAGLPSAVLAAETDDANAVIVTGTRDVGVKAFDSATPIEVIGSEQLEATGATSALDALKEVLPSFAVTAFNGDAGALVRTARLRGMNPGEVLVLVDGKRRHLSSSIIPGGSDQSPDAGSDATDLDMIPVSLIDHVEVLLDGASAQYGSDAVAGVINFILKHDSSGTTANALGGITTRGDGAQGAGGVMQALPLGPDGFIDISADYRHQDFTNRNTINCKTYASGCPGNGGIGLTNVYGQIVAPTRNRITGTPLSDLTNLGFNAEKPLNNDVTLYAFATFGRRSTQGYENDRPANKAPVYWPDGFFPREELNEVDSSITAGIKGSHLMGWDWDLSATYGRDSDHFSLANSYNTGLSNPVAYGGLGLDQNFTGGTLGSAVGDQTTLNADFRRGFFIDGLAAPLNVAVGAEFRYEGYTLGAGDKDTYIDGGTQSEAGLTPTDASSHTRTVEAVYADLSTKFLPKWTTDLAGRFEDYSQVGIGSTETGKLTNRYDFTPQFGIRGTISTGFHAPSLAQSYYSATGVSPTSLSIEAPPTSPGAQLLGAQPLQPETSKDLSFGLVWQPIERAHITADVYQVFLDHQIIDSPQVFGPTTLAVATANGNPIPAALLASTTVYAHFFNNGIDTRTRGLDVTGDYKSDFGRFGTVKWSMAGNVNSIAITNQYAIPTLFAQVLKFDGLPQSFVSPQIKTDITKSSPANKLTMAAEWRWKGFDVTLRETRYGHADETNGTSTAVTPFSNIYIKSAYITDVDVTYQLTDNVKLDVGGNNVFDHEPGHVPYVLQESSRASNLYPYYTPWGINGAYFYSRITASF